MEEAVSVIGLGYIGLPFTAALAHVGYRVIGVDINEERIRKLQETYEPDIYEPGLNETLQKNKKGIQFTTDYDYALRNSDSALITVGTPLLDDHDPDYSHLDSALTQIGENLREDHLIILKSTVVVGTTRDYATPRLESVSGLKEGRDFYVAYSPERTIEGLALHELYTLPKIVGGLSKEGTERAGRLLSRLGGPIVGVSSPEVAETCKLADNLFRSMNIAFANEIGEFCESTGINAHEVVGAVNSAYDRTHLFRPGLGADGPCLTKDPEIFRYSARSVGLGTEMTDGCLVKNKQSTLRLADKVSRFIEEEGIGDPRVALVGLAFKGFPETDDLRGSPALKIQEELEKRRSINFTYYDPLVKGFLDGHVKDSIEDAVKDANVAMLLTNHPRLMNLDVSLFLEHMRSPMLVVDCWGNVANLEQIAEEGGSIFRVGNGVHSNYT